VFGVEGIRMVGMEVGMEMLEVMSGVKWVVGKG
jgi:hypothetical protein